MGLINKSEIKRVVRKGDVRVSIRFLELLEAKVLSDVDLAINRAKRNHRTTVMVRDL